MRRILIPLIFGLAGTALLAALGVWQVQRLNWKNAILAEIEARIAADPVPLPELADPAGDRYLPVRLTGTVEPGELHVLVSRKQVGAGYRIVAPFQTQEGRRILLDRGFVPIEAKDAPRPTGPATVLGNLHWPDERIGATPDNDPARNIWFARDLGQMAGELGTEPLLVVARQETPAPPGVTPLPVGTEGIPNDHLQYALTWFSLAAVWAAMSVFYLWRIRQRGARS